MLLPVPCLRLPPLPGGGLLFRLRYLRCPCCAHVAVAASHRSESLPCSAVPTASSAVSERVLVGAGSLAVNSLLYDPFYTHTHARDLRRKEERAFLSSACRQHAKQKTTGSGYPFASPSSQLCSPAAIPIACRPSPVSTPAACDATSRRPVFPSSPKRGSAPIFGISRSERSVLPKRYICFSKPQPVGADCRESRDTRTQWARPMCAHTYVRVDLSI